MKSRSHFGAGGVVALVVVVVVVIGAAIFGLRGGKVEVVPDNRPVIPAPERGTAVVAFLRTAGGHSLMGIRLVDSTHYVEVQFLSGPGCSALLHSGDPWPTNQAQCSSPAKVVGRVGGLGVTPSGDSLVGVEFKVSRACFELLKPGTAWPSTLPDCTQR